MNSEYVETLLSVRNLVKNFELRASKGFRKTQRVVQAVADVSFDVKVGQTLGLVGESGSGKTTVGRSVLQLLTPTSGEVLFEGKDLIYAWYVLLHIILMLRLNTCVTCNNWLYTHNLC